MSNITPERYRRRSTISFVGEISMTEQCHKDEVCIQKIMQKYKKTGVISHVSAHVGTYMDYANIPDYTEAQNIIADAKSMFESVPSHIRDDFDNSAALYIEFMQNPENREKIKAYGLDTSHLPAPVEPVAKQKPAKATQPEAPAEKAPTEATTTLKE